MSANQLSGHRHHQVCAAGEDSIGSFYSTMTTKNRPSPQICRGIVKSVAELDLAICSLDDQDDVSNVYWEDARAEPALGIGKLSSRLGPPIGGGLAQES